MKYQAQWTFSSRSDPNKTYKVSLKLDGKYICGCWPFLRTRKPCQHIESVLSGNIDADGKPIKKKIVLAQVKQVILGEGDQVFTPLIPIEDTWFQASLIYDLLRAGITWSEIKGRYDLARRNSKNAIVDYIKQRGRKVYADLGGAFKSATFIKIDADEPLPRIGGGQ